MLLHRSVPFHVGKQLEEQLQHEKELEVIEPTEGPNRNHQARYMCVHRHMPGEQGDQTKTSCHPHHGTYYLDQVHHHLQHSHGSHEVQMSHLWHFKHSWDLRERNLWLAWGYWWRSQHQWQHTSGVLKQQTFLRSQTLGRLPPVWIKYGVSGAKRWRLSNEWFLSHRPLVCVLPLLFQISSLIAFRIPERSLSLKGTRTFSLSHSHMSPSRSKDFNAKGESTRTTCFHFKTKEFILIRL